MNSIIWLKLFICIDIFYFYFLISEFGLVLNLLLDCFSVDLS